MNASRTAVAAACLVCTSAIGASGSPFHFPRDHSPHPRAPLESWAFTGHLAAAGGTGRFAVQLVLHRLDVDRSLAPNPHRPYELRAVHPVQLAVTDLVSGRFEEVARVERNGPGTATLGGPPLRFSSRAWEVEERAGRFLVVAGSDSVAVDLVLTPAKPFTGLGREGVFTEHEDDTLALRYVLPRLETRGTVRIGGRSMDVAGVFWLDHLWGESVVRPGEAGWDFLNVQLTDGADLCLYRVRSLPGRTERRLGGVYVTASGVVMRLESLNPRFYPLGTNRWVSPETGISYPIRWRIEVAALELRVDVSTEVSEQELATYRTHGATIWRGAIDAEGRRGNERITGEGFLEMVGYGGGFPPEVARAAQGARVLP